MVRPLSLSVVTLLVACAQDTSITKEAKSISVSPALADAGIVAVGDSVELSIQLTHKSGDDVTVVDASIVPTGSYFALVDAGLPTVPKGGTAELVVTYTPLAAGFHTAQLQLTTDEDGVDTHSVQLRGEAASADWQVYPSLVDFGVVASGTTGTASLSLVNNAIITGSLVSATVSDPAFVVTDTLPMDVDKGATGTLGLSYSASGDDAVSAELLLTFGDGSTQTVSLRANDCEEGQPELYDLDADGYTTCGGDCDDEAADVHPGTTEVCDAVDNDCDGSVDETTPCGDDDGDGWADADGDCNDADAGVNPDAAEDYANGVDDDCDGVVDYGTTDDDADGFAPSGGDCDDLDGDVHPGALETANGVDDDCDGVTDEGTSAYDDDADGWTEEGGDCDDSDVDVFPGAAELVDGIDDDCDGTVDEGTSGYDDDGDGFTEDGGDCDDTDGAVNPAQLETTGNGVDDNCDGVTQ